MYIGILTHCVANNFGANLQSLSTASYLKTNGYEPVFIRWDSYLEERNRFMSPEQLDIHQHFLEKHGFVVTDSCRTDEDIVNIIKRYNIKNIIIGSDAVFTVDSWIEKVKISRRGFRYKSQLDKTFPNPFWIPFRNQIDDDLRYFYLSPSCQSSLYRLWSVKDKKRMKECLSHASFISARDRYTSEMIKYILNTEIPTMITPDPVWGFNYNFTNLPSKEAIIKKYNLKENYLLVSFYKGAEPDSIWFTNLERDALEHDMYCYSLPMPQGIFNSPLNKNISLPLNPIDWYCLIKYAKGYIGHNMHPVIVSIHNQIPFFSIDQHGRKIISRIVRDDKSSKIYDLLDRLGLLEYRISKNSLKKIHTSEICKKIIEFDTKKEAEISQRMYVEFLDLMTAICHKLES